MPARLGSVRVFDRSWGPIGGFASARDSDCRSCGMPTHGVAIDGLCRDCYRSTPKRPNRRGRHEGQDEGQNCIAAQLAAAVATGSPEWLPGSDALRTNIDAPAPVTIAGDHITRSRLREDCPAFVAAARAHPANVRFLGMSGHWPLWAASGEQGPRLTATGAKLRESCASAEVSLLIVDCVEQAFRKPPWAEYESGENPTDIGESTFLADWSAWAGKVGCTVLFMSAGRSLETSWWIDRPRIAWTFEYRTEAGHWTSSFSPMKARLNLAKSNYSDSPRAVDLEWDVDWRHWTAAGLAEA